MIEYFNRQQLHRLIWETSVSRIDQDDIWMTKRLEEFSRDAEIDLLNCVIVGDNDVWILA